MFSLTENERLLAAEQDKDAAYDRWSEDANDSVLMMVADGESEAVLWDEDEFEIDDVDDADEFLFIDDGDEAD